MKTAVIGIGSNSVRMLLGDVLDDKVVRVRRERAGTRLFAGLDERRMLSEEAMERTVSAVAEMSASARADGVCDVRLFATSASRDAANGETLVRLLRERAMVEPEIISGEEEAVLSFAGASGGGYAGVMDIGGGSTEIVVGSDERIDCAFSCQMGAVRLFRALPIASAADLPAVLALSERILEEKLREQSGLPAKLPESWFGTGGTFTALAALVNNDPWTDRSRTSGTLLRQDSVEAQAIRLAGMTLDERLALGCLQPGRADIAVHGICILLACMRRLGIDGIRVSEAGNLDGYLRRRFGLPLAGNA